MIIDVQQCFDPSYEILDKVLEYSSNYSNIIYVYDVLNESKGFNDMWDEMYFAYEEGTFDPNHIISKEYAFFRNLMDEGYPDEFIVELGKFMIKYGLYDAREIYEEENYLHEDFQKICDKHLVEEPDFESLTFYLTDLKDDLDGKVFNGVVLVGGGRDECLKEVALLLDIMDIKYSIEESLCY